MRRVARSVVILAATAACTAGASPTSAQTQPEIMGRWATQGFGSIVEFQPCAGEPSAACGRIVWLWTPQNAAGRPRVDVHNPDPALRVRPLIGAEIVRGLRQTAPGVWSDGQLYNPDDGRTYAGTIRLREGRLELRGCALAVFCQTQTWRRPQDVFAAGVNP